VRWIVGLDLRPGGDGPLELAAWLHALAPSHRLVGVHAIEGEPLGGALSDADSAGLERAAAQLLAERLGATGTAGAFDEVMHRFGAADEVLETALLGRRADGLVIGRRARTTDEVWVRLGRVARRLLRRLPAPTLVAPPELVRAGIPPGPILALTDLRDDSVAATALAGRLASDLGRELVVAHAVTRLERWIVYLPRATPDEERHDVLALAATELDAWIGTHDLRPARRHVHLGGLAAVARRVAHEERAAIVACGSRGLGGAERMLIPSTGSELAAGADRPVLIVPADFA
jgi:nucleotide-binding universal stress UspA family protein